MRYNRLKDISTQYKKDLKNLIQSLDEIKPRIACTGLLNAGKSTLLNTLIGDIDNQTFLTADIRETTDSKKIVYNKLTYIDTPRLDATEQDTQVVINVLKEADIGPDLTYAKVKQGDEVVFVFLKLILENWSGPRTFIEQTIFVLSKIDAMNVEDEKREIENTSKKIKSQIRTLFECEATVISVSAESYQDGVRDNETLLQQYSNFSSLKRKIEKLVKDKVKKIDENKIQRIETKFQDIKMLLTKEKEELETEKVLMHKNYNKQKNDFVKEVVQLNKVLQVKESNYEKL